MGAKRVAGEEIFRLPTDGEQRDDRHDDGMDLLPEISRGGAETTTAKIYLKFHLIFLV